MSETNVVQLFEKVDEQTLLIQKEMNEPYLDSLSICMEFLYFNDAHTELPEAFRTQIQEELKEIALDSYTTQEIHKAIQLTILKGMQKTTQHQHAITPETVALFIGYLAEKVMKNKTAFRLFDPVAGTGNLLLTVLDHLKKDVAAYASEVDTTLLRIALSYTNLLKKQVEFFHQDSLRPLLLDPVDLVVADLPVGYYPDDMQAASYELKAEEGHSYAHHLLIEQSLHHTKPGGFLIFVIPESLFSSDQSDQLNAFIQKYAHIIGVVQLSDATFKSKSHKKSVFILQKKGKDTKDVKQPLLVMLPSFNNTKAMEDIMNQIDNWFQEVDIHHQ